MANGSIRIGLDYGNPLYTIRIYNDDFPFAFGDIFVFGDTLLFDNLSADGYTIEIEYETLSDIRRDTFIDVTLTNESGITINTTALSSPACIDDSNGMIINEISGGLEPYRYLWNDGSEELIRTGLSAGDYQLIVIDDRSCRDTFNFEMVNPDPIVFEIDRTPPSCFGASDGELRFINIMGGTGDYGYNIGFGEQASPIFSNLGSGNYILSVEDSNGCIVDGLETISDPSVFSINLGDDITVDNIGEVQLGLTSNAPMTNISWLPDDNLSCSDCPNPIASITNTVSYQVTANSESGGCTAADQITVILDIDRTVDPAQAFTPNGDGVNDIFIVHGNNSIAEISNIEIYARSGELVWKQESFPINDPNFGWDGTYQGEPMTSQILGYFIEVLYTDGKARIFKGQLALIR
jgi:gliding motility-associated-like protein